MPVHTVVDPKRFASPLADKHMMTRVLVKCGKYWQRLESLVTDTTGVKQFPILFCAFVLHQFLAGVKFQVAVPAGRGVLVTYAAPVQHHHELP